MRVLVASKFLHHVGGVETYMAWLAQHLPRTGVDVAFFGMAPPIGEPVMAEMSGPVFLSPNRDYHGTFTTKVRSAAASVYSKATAAAMVEALERFSPDLVHFQSTCYQLTPSVVSAVARRGIPMVTTAHEYKFVCSNQRLWDDGKGQSCTRCLDGSIVKRMGNILSTRCVKGSLASSLIAATELPVSNAVWKNAPGLVHAPSRFMAELLEGDGSPVKGHVRYLDLAWGDAQLPLIAQTKRNDVAYLGRLSSEKGIETLIAAWPQVSLRKPDARLRILGAGSDEARLRSLAAGIPGIEFFGRYDRNMLSSILSTAAMTVHPSVWAENSPYTVRESLQHGVPAIVSDQGGLPEMVNAHTGTVVPAANADALSIAILGEFDSRRAGNDELLAAVAQRSLGDDDHMSGLQRIYDEAGSLVRRAS